MNNSRYNTNRLKERSRKLALRLASVTAVSALSIIAAHAQSPTLASLPSMIGEGGPVGTQQGIASGMSFLIYAPGSQNAAPSVTPPPPATFGVTEAFNLLNPGESTDHGLSLTGAALFADPNSAGKNQAQKQAINQTITLNKGSSNFTLGFVDVGKLFAADTSSSSPLSPSIAQDLNGKKGQTGFNTGYNFNQSGTKIGLQFSTVADMLQSQHRMSETMSLERDFDKSLTMSFQRTQNNSEQMASNAAAHVTNDIMHLAYSPTRSGFLLDATSTERLTDNGMRSNDVLLKVAQHFAALNLSSQFETAGASSGGGSDWSSQRIDANGTIRPGLTFSGYWAKKQVHQNTGDDDFDVIIKSNESRYMQLVAEYSKDSPTTGPGSLKQSLVATITPGSVGPLGPLFLNLAINSQQNPSLDGLQSYTASLNGTVQTHTAFNFGLTGAKYYLAYTDSSVGGATSPTGQRISHSARTLRLVSGPSGKNGLSWTVSQQQRLDQNGQPLRTASDLQVKYTLDQRVSISTNNTFETARNDGSFSDQDDHGVSLNYTESQTTAMIAEYVHTRCPSQNVSGEDAFTLTYKGPALPSNKMDIGLGAQTKHDYLGKDAVGTTANVDYGWQADQTNLLNFSSKLTDWRNQGFNNDYDSSVEATGQINFQRVF